MQRFFLKCDKNLGASPSYEHGWREGSAPPDLGSRRSPPAGGEMGAPAVVGQTLKWTRPMYEQGGDRAAVAGRRGEVEGSAEASSPHVPSSRG